ncbi:MAG TPA: Clp protease N-terminal domain-containing protein [Solirubrobacteraceae bacterium]|jgi:ATP-dependent Clp protease ATP-binding subunit ClpA|nr:Clp protease N-terminal domain-containing protein [Solirubrobacteraceae bacterium]
MFERFTEEARQVIVAAQEEARLLDHDRIGTEHILIGLLRSPDDLPGRAMSGFGVDADTARAKVTETFGRGNERRSGQMPFTRSGKKALELALRTTLNLGHNWIESGHVLLGVIDVGESPGREILTGLGVDVDSLRERTVALLSETDRTPEHGREATRRPSVEIREAGRDVGLDVGRFTVVPDARVQRVLMAAAGRALQQARKEFGIEDVLEALKDFPPGEDSPRDAEK